MAGKKNTYPVLPLRDIVVYPKMIVPLFVGREKSIRALQDVVDKDQNIILATQKNAATEDPTSDDVFHVGTVGTVLQMLKLPDGTVKVLIEGMERVKITKFLKILIIWKFRPKSFQTRWKTIRNWKRLFARFCRSLKNMSNCQKDSAGSVGFG